MKNKGITLLALVITIIALLVLAGITVAALFGNNGILRRAVEATQKYNEKATQEKVSIAAMDSFDSKGKFQKEALKENLKNNLGIDENDIEETEDGELVFPVDGHDVTITPEGQIEVEPIEPVNPEQDKTPPEILSAKSNSNGTITITAKDEGGTGIAAYAITTEAIAPERESPQWKESRSKKWTSSEEYEDGEYYVWVKDKAGNISQTVYSVIVSEKETQKPTIEVDSDKVADRSQTATITIKDEEDGSGLAKGIYHIKYAWQTENKEPEWSIISEETTIEVKEEGVKSATGTIQKSGVTGRFYLYVQAQDLRDVAGNTDNPVAHGEFAIDNEGPTVQFSEQSGEYAKSHNPTVTVTDKGPATLDDGSLKYVWVEGTAEQQEETITKPFTNENPIPTEEDKNGEWYLWVIAKDNLQNKTIAHAGPFKLDNTGPEITFEPTTKTEYAQTQSTKVTITDKGGSTINNEQLKYLWNQDGENAPKEDSFKDTFTIQGNVGTISNSKETGSNWYVWVMAKDNLQNKTIAHAGPFYLDNTPPDDTAPEVVATTDTITVTLRQEDEHSQINEETAQYQIKKSASESWPGDEEWKTSNIFASLEKETEYDVRTRVKDNVGNGYAISKAKEKIKTEKIEKPKITAVPSETEWTKDDVNITITYTEGTTLTKQYADSKIGEEIQWKDTSDNPTTFKIGENKTIYARQIDKSNNSSEVESLEINKIDKGKPEIKTATATDTWTKESKTITVTAEDTGTPTASGIAAYAITKEANEPSTEDWKTVQDGKTEWTSEAKPAGNYSAWVKDVAGNISEEAFPVVIEKIETEGPTIEVDSDPEADTTQTATITIKDEEEGSGLAEGTYHIKYAWQEQDEEPEWGSILEETTIEVTEAGAKSATGKIEKSGVTGRFYLYVQAQELKDVAGNTGNPVAHGEFAIDNEGPTVQFSEQSGEYAKSHNPTVTVTDKGPATLDDGSLKYVWVEGTAEQQEETITKPFTNENPIPTEEDKNGEWYLWVIAKDNLQNKTIAHAGPFKLDNTGPEITFEPTTKTEYAQTQSTNVTITEKGGSTIDNEQLKYLWNQDGENPPEEGSFKNTFTIQENVGTISNSEETGNDWYVWVLAKDELGNASTKVAGPFWLDNTPPDDTAPTITSTTTSQVVVAIAQTDKHSQINEETAEYQIKKSESESWPGDGEWKTSNIFTGLEKETDYVVRSRVKDNAENGYTISQQSEIARTKTIAKPEIKANQEEKTWTKEDIEITITYTDTEGSTLTKQYADNKVGEEIQWNDTDENPYIFSIGENKTIYARQIDDANNTSEVASLEITKIDKGKPSIKTATVTDADTWTKESKTIKVTAEDTGTPEASGIAAYAITSGEAEPLDNDWKQVTSGATEWTSEAKPAGNYSAWVKDIAGNVSETAFTVEVGNIETEAPTIEVKADKEESAKSHSATITIKDEESGSGLDQGIYHIKYAWQTENQEPEWSGISEETTIEVTEAGVKSATGTIEKSEVTGIYYLYVQAQKLKDVAQNTSNPVASAIFKFDNIGPKVTFTTNGGEEYKKDYSTTVTVSEKDEQGNGTVDNASLKYLWKNSAAKPTEEEFAGDLSDSFVSGTTNISTTKIPIESRNGEWYLWILAKDTLENATIISSNVFKLDNLAPNVHFVQGPDNAWAQSHSKTVNVDDDGIGMADVTLKYAWKQADSGVTEESHFTGTPPDYGTFAAGETITKNTGTGDDWYLWIFVKDSLGNSKIDKTGPFWLDNTPPDDVAPAESHTTSTITVISKQNDIDSGLNADTRYYQYKETSVSDWTDEWVKDNNPSHKFTGLKANTSYDVRTKIEDTAGNANTSKHTTLITSDISEPQITVNPTGSTWTNDKVEVTINYPETPGAELTKQYKYTGSNGKDWTTTTETTETFDISENNVTVYAKQYEEQNLNEKVKSEEITNIDKEKPEVTNATANKDGSITVEASDNGGSKISAYAITTNDNVPEETSPDWKPVEAGTASWTSEKKTDGTYYAWVKDGAKNISATGYTVTVLTREINPLKYGSKVTGVATSELTENYEWQLFYEEDGDIYLIASDYIHTDDCPVGQNGNTIVKNGTNYTNSMNNVIKDYAGSSDITDSEMKALNNDFFTNNYSSTTDNMKAVAYMLDRKQWTNKFTGNANGNSQIDYVIGGPSIELLFKSYNAKYGTDYKAKCMGETGYNISSGGDTDSDYQTYISNMLKTDDRTYVISDTAKANYMWVTSPSAYDSGSVMLVDCNGRVGSCLDYRFNAGFRPIIKLKPGTKLIEKEDGSFEVRTNKYTKIWS